MSAIRFYLLGAPRLEQDGRPLEVDTRKAIALLAYLVVTGKPHTRDALAALLWPDYSQSNARAALRRTLSALRKALDPDALEISRDLVALAQPTRLNCDLWDFQQLIASTSKHGHSPNHACPRCLEPLEKAVSLYQDSFMAGFGLRDSPTFDDWEFFQDEALRREAGSALERLAHGYMAEGNFEAAITHAQHRLSIDQLHEPSHRLLMEAFARAGRRNAALHQYQECVRILESELGVPPLEETTQLYEQIKDHKEPWSISPGDDRTQALSVTATAPEKDPDKVRPTIAQLPLVGRNIELEALGKAYSQVGQVGRLVAIEGEAGIGKTHLAEEFLASVQSNGAIILTAHCYPGEKHLAYAPFVDALRRAIVQSENPNWQAAIADQWLSEATRLLPELASPRNNLSPLPVQESTGAQIRFFESIRQIILAILGSAKPGVVFFDDLQWADEATLDLFTYIIKRLNNSPLLVLASWQIEDPESINRLRRLTAEAQREGIGKLVRLERLALESVKEVLHKVSSPASRFSDRLHKETEGLPFFIAEYLAAMPANALTNPDMEWKIPHGVRDLLRARLEQIDETSWQLLQTAAVIGRSFDFDTLREASGRTEDETVTTLETLIQRSLIRESNPNQDEGNPEDLRHLYYDFNHDKMRAQVYAETSLARRRLLHQRVAEALVGRARGRKELLNLSGQIAYHYKLCGRPREAAEYYKQAGEHARSLHANQEALAQFQSALALGHPDPAWLNEAMGDMHTFLGAYSAAINSYETALAYQQDKPDSLAAIEHKLGNVFHRLGEWERALSHYQIAEEVMAESESASFLSRLYADWSHTLHRQEQIVLAEQMAGRALQMAENSGDELAHAQAHNILGMLNRKQGNLDEAIHQLQQSLSVAEALANPGLRVATLNNLSLAYASLPDLKKAIKLAQQALQLCSQQGDLHREAALHNNLADLYHAAGLREESMQHLKQAVVIFAQVGAEEGEKPRPEIWKLTEW